MTTIHIEGHGLSVTDAIDSYTRTKIEKLRTFFNNITAINVILRLDANQHHAEATILIPNQKNNLHAKAVSDNLYKSIDLLERKLAEILRKHHDMQRSHK